MTNHARLMSAEGLSRFVANATGANFSERELKRLGQVFLVAALQRECGGPQTWPGLLKREVAGMRPTETGIDEASLLEKVFSAEVKDKQARRRALDSIMANVPLLLNGSQAELAIWKSAGVSRDPQVSQSGQSLAGREVLLKRLVRDLDQGHSFARGLLFGVDLPGDNRGWGEAAAWLMFRVNLLLYYGAAIAVPTTLMLHLPQTSDLAAEREGWLLLSAGLGSAFLWWTAGPSKPKEPSRKEGR